MSNALFDDPNQWHCERGFRLWSHRFGTTEQGWSRIASKYWSTLELCRNHQSADVKSRFWSLDYLSPASCDFVTTSSSLSVLYVIAFQIVVGFRYVLLPCHGLGGVSTFSSAIFQTRHQHALGATLHSGFSIVVSAIYLLLYEKNVEYNRWRLTLLTSNVWLICAFLITFCCKMVSWHIKFGMDHILSNVVLPFLSEITFQTICLIWHIPFPMNFRLWVGPGSKIPGSRSCATWIMSRGKPSKSGSGDHLTGCHMTSWFSFPYLLWGSFIPWESQLLSVVNACHRKQFKRSKLKRFISPSRYKLLTIDNCQGKWQ